MYIHVCSNMDGPRDYHTKPGRQKISHNITYMWNLNYDTKGLIDKTDITDIEHRLTDIENNLQI